MGYLDFAAPLLQFPGGVSTENQVSLHDVWRDMN